MYIRIQHKNNELKYNFTYQITMTLHPEPQAMSKIFVLHENSTWVEPLRAAFNAQGLPFEEWFLDQGDVDLASEPPEGVFYNRMSASSHTRDHRHAAELTSVVLAWLESHGRRVVNRGRALELEINKAKQYAALAIAGIRTPRTVAVVGRDQLLAAADTFGEEPLILKPNRGGKGAGVQLFATADALKAHVLSDAYEAPIDGIQLLQQYIRAPEPFITRAEFIGGKFQYAVRVSTADGFELCPADACQIGDAFCPTTPGAKPQAAAEPLPKFRILEGRIDEALIAAYETFLAGNGIEIAGIEFITDADGVAHTYDVNTNTNYNPEAEARAKRSGMGEIARFLGRELAKRYPDSRAPSRRSAG